MARFQNFLSRLQNVNPRRRSWNLSILGPLRKECAAESQQSPRGVQKVGFWIFFALFLRLQGALFRDSGGPQPPNKSFQTLFGLFRGSRPTVSAWDYNSGRRSPRTSANCCNLLENEEFQPDPKQCGELSRCFFGCDHGTGSSKQRQL